MPSQVELWVNADESGKMEMTFDLGEMVDMMMGMMETFGMDSMMGGKMPTTDGSTENGVIEQNSNLFAEMPDSVKSKLPYPELMGNVQMMMKVDTLQMSGFMKISMTYDNHAQYKQIIENFRALEEEPSGMAMMLGGEDMDNMFVTYESDLDKGLFTLKGLDRSTLENDPDFMELVELRDSFENMDAESREMLEMFFGGSTKTIVHLPGKVKNCSDSGAKIKGETVEFEDNLIRIATGEQELYDREIKFKKVKR